MSSYEKQLPVNRKDNEQLLIAVLATYIYDAGFLDLAIVINAQKHINTRQPIDLFLKYSATNLQLTFSLML